jgi:plastocyanin
MMLRGIIFFFIFVSASAFADQAPLEIQMKSLSYLPKKVEISAGQAIVWKNTSYTKHSATSEDGKTFDTGMVAPGHASREILFNQPGDFIYHCSMHGKTMSGEIVVKALGK